MGFGYRTAILFVQLSCWDILAALATMANQAVEAIGGRLCAKQDAKMASERASMGSRSWPLSGMSRRSWDVLGAMGTQAPAIGYWLGRALLCLYFVIQGANQLQDPLSTSRGTPSLSPPIGYPLPLSRGRTLPHM